MAERLKALDFAMTLLREGVLSIDSEGRIWRIRARGSRIQPRRAENVGGKGYLRVALQLPEGKPAMVMAHRLVWEWLVGPIPEGLQINHKDPNKQNNRPDNLEVVTGAANIQHSYANGRTRPWSSATTWRGRPRISEAQREEIRAMRSRGALLREIASKVGLGTSHVHRIIKGSV